MKALLDRLAQFRRSAWIPETVDGEGAADASRFAGRPAVRAGEAWPRCGNCGLPMQLFLQLNARDLPPEPARRLGGGILQLFYCTNYDLECDVSCEAWAPNSKASLARLVPAGEPVVFPAETLDGMYPPKRIVRWAETADYPNSEELEDLGVALKDQEYDLWADGDFPLAGEKLLGWPYWVQGIEYPECPECGRRMEMLFQIDSEGHLPFMFGDSGVGHVTQCPEHRDRLAFGWACC